MSLSVKADLGEKSMQVNTTVSEPPGGTGLADKGFSSFVAIWVSQFTTALATALSGFGLNVWVFQKTNSVTAVSLLATCLMLPRLFTIVFAGAVVDRYGPRLAIIAGNVGTLFSLLPSLVLFWGGQPKLWHIFLSLTLVSIWQSLIGPAVLASVPLVLGKKDFVRANGMLQAGSAASAIIAPLVGGLMVVHFELATVLAISLATYAVSIPILALTRIPRADGSNASQGTRSYLKEVSDAWGFLRYDPVLLRLTLVFGASSFVVAIATVLMKPLVLSFASPSALGTVMSLSGVGLLLGGLVVTALGKGATSFKQVMSLMGIAGFCMALAGSRPMVFLIALATLAYFFTMAIVSSGVQTIIQSSVPVALQGRVHATLAATSLATMPLAFPIAGPLADYVFEPLLADGGMLAGNVGRVIGVGAGRGIGLLFVILGSFIIGLSLIGRSEPRKEFGRANALAVNEQE